MCNFWDEANLFGLHDCFYDQAARALDSARKQAIADHAAGKPLAPGSKLPPTVRANVDEGVRELKEPVEYVVTHGPWIYLRSEPTTDAEVLAISRPGKRLRMSHSLDGWLRTAEPVHKDKHGWALEVGAKLGLGVLLTPVRA